MKKLLTVVATTFTILSASAAPDVVFSFGNPALEKYFKDQKYTIAIQQAAEETIGNIGDKYTIAFIGDYGIVENGTRCVYSISAFISVKYKTSLIIDMNSAGISRSMGTQPIFTKDDKCEKALQDSINYVAAESIKHIKTIEEEKANKKLQTPAPKNQKQI